MEKRLLRRFRGFVQGITARDRVCVLFHPDADGLCAAFIASNALKKLRGKGADLVHFQPRSETSVSEKTLRLLKKKKFTKLIVVDLSVDQNPATVRRAAKFLDVLVIDHHKIYADLNSAHTVFLKPQLLGRGDAASYPASKLCFDLFSSVVGLSDLRWIAAVGIIGDNAEKRWRAFINSVPRRNRISVKNLRCLEGVISGVESMRQGMLISLFKELCKIGKPADLCHSKFYALKKKLDREIALLEKKFRRGVEKFPALGLEYFQFSSPFNIKSALINRLSKRKPHTTFIFVQDSGKSTLSFSARRQDGRVRVNDLLEKAVKGLKGASAGGHAPAAAGRVMRRDLGEFKERVISLHPKEKKFT
ncbi:MAG: DHH family phosphoesterase [Candidatus Diapherotrites archaeon]